MEHIQLNNTDLLVSPLCLGTSQYGTGRTEEFSLRQLDAYRDRGGNFLDTAHVYGDWEPGQTARSERLIGRWLKGVKNRDKLVIMTKGAHPRLETMHIPRCKPKDIETDLDESLACLGTDYIDMYLLHRDDVSVPAADILDCLEQERKKGKIRHYGCSNWTLARIKEIQTLALKGGAEGFTCNQIKWSLAEANVENIADKSMVLMEQETWAWHKSSGVNVTEYNSTAHGWFSKLYKGQTPPDKVRSLYENQTNDELFKIIRNALKKYSLTVTDISLGYLMSQPFTSVPVTSFSSEDQFEEGMHACGVKLPREFVDELNRAKGLL
jgi:aryl-alcohol dehydrogenase-like predicted oxidoreductase